MFRNVRWFHNLESPRKTLLVKDSQVRKNIFSIFFSRWYDLVRSRTLKNIPFCIIQFITRVVTARKHTWNAFGTHFKQCEHRTYNSDIQDLVFLFSQNTFCIFKFFTNTCSSFTIFGTVSYSKTSSYDMNHHQMTSMMTWTRSL